MMKFPLDGRIEEFPVFRILAEIGTHSLSGVLTISDHTDTVDLYFDSGACVFAESHYPRKEILLGQLLVMRGYCGQHQLDEMLKVQSVKMLKLGRLARDAGWLTDTELIRVLEDQILLIVFPCLTWNRGIFFFKKTDTIPYDQTLFRPVDLKPIYRSGQKILKSWSWMKERIASDDIVLQRVPGIEVIPEGVKLEHSNDVSNPKVLTRIQEKVYELVDGNRTIREICDSVHLFEWFSRVAILDLQDAAIVIFDENSGKKKRKKSHLIKSEKRGNLRDSILPYIQLTAKILSVFVAIAIIGFLVSRVSFKHLQQPEKPVVRKLTPKALTITQNRAGEIRSAMVIYYLFEDHYPDVITNLSNNRLLDLKSLSDGWETEFQYQKTDEGYSLRSSGPDGSPFTDDDMVFTGQVSDHVFGCYYPGSPVSVIGDIEQ